MRLVMAIAISIIAASQAASALKPDLYTVDFRYAPVGWQTAICLPDDWQKTLVGKDGCLLYDYPGKFSDFKTRIRASLAGEPRWVRQELETPRVPIVRTVEQSGNIEAILEGFALPSRAEKRKPALVERVGSLTVQSDWAQPVGKCDPAFRGIAVGYGQPVHYRIRAPRGGACRIALGLCEAWYSEPGKRILDLQVEGRSRRTVDMIAEHGRNVPAVYEVEARDENGDGFIDLQVCAVPNSPDANTVLSALWVLPTAGGPTAQELLEGASSRALCRIACGQPQLGGAPRTDALLLTLKNAGQAEETAAPALTIDSELPVTPSGDLRQIAIGPDLRLTCDRPCDQVEKTASGIVARFAPVKLAPGKSVTLAFSVTRGAAPYPNLGHPAELRRTAERFWERAPLPYDRITVPDAGIQALLDSSIRNIYQAREIKGGLPAFQVGPTCYRGLWVVDGSFLLEAAAYLGRTEEARHGVEYLLSFQRPDGGFSLIDGHWKETGIALWAVTRHARLTGDRDWLEEEWPRIERGFDYIVAMRDKAADDPSKPNWRLVPEGFSDGGLGGKYPEYTNIYWTLAGMRAAVEAAKWLGKEATAAGWQREYESFFAAFRAAAERDARTDAAGHRFVPIRMRDDQHVAPQKAQWAFLHALYPGQVFASDDPLVQGNLAMLEAVQDEGMVHGTGWLDEGIWNYFGSFYAHGWLWAGRGEKAAQVMYAFANHASPLLAWREEQMPVGKGPAICGDMPHNWASAEMIRLVRHLLALERGDELHILEGIPATWLRPGAVTRLHEEATEFGPLSLELTVAKDGRTARLRVDPPTRTPPARLVLHLGAWADSPGTQDISPTRRAEITLRLKQPAATRL